MRAVLAIGAALALAACNAGGSGADDPPDNAVAPAPAATPSPKVVSDLSRYVGKYPSDQLDGRSFMTEPAVRATVERATADPALRAFVLEGKGPETPIAMNDGRVTAWGCEQHNCGDHNWTVQVAPDGASGGLCIEDAAKGQATWYADGKPERRSAACPEAG